MSESVPRPRRLSRVAVFTLGGFLIAAVIGRVDTLGYLSGVHAQSPDQKPPLAFEVASVKPGNSDPGGYIRPLPGGQSYTARNASLRLMIKLMYRITDRQIVGGPGWMDTERWSVDAKAERPSTVDQLHEMFQTLLADGFQLRFHKEKKTLQAFVLTVEKGGPKLRTNQSPEPFDIPIRPGGPGKLVGTRVPMPYLCWFMAQMMDTPVVDGTGLTGNYDFTFEMPPPPLGDAGGPDGGRRLTPAEMSSEIFAAMREQLGLKFESRKTAVEVFVIDGAERPEVN